MQDSCLSSYDFIIDRSTVFSDLEEYAIDFLDYVEKNGTNFVVSEQESGYFKEMVFSEYGEIMRVMWNSIRDIFYKKAEISEDEIKEIASKTIKDYHAAWSGWREILPVEKAKEFRKRLRIKFDKEILEIIKSGFEEFELLEDDLNKLFEIGLFKFSKMEGKLSHTPSPFTGIVFAGYGKDNLFPICVNFDVYCYLCDTLVFFSEPKRRRGIGFTKEGATSWLIPFAQDDVIQNILNGRLQYYEVELRNKLSKKLSKKEVESVIENVNREIWKTHTQPIIDTIDVLPKDELASVARTLVSLTSFMRRVSSDIESVGGPIDVAVISKKDGFIWIDRKHYFDINKNIHFTREKG